MNNVVYFSKFMSNCLSVTIVSLNMDEKDQFMSNLNLESSLILELNFSSNCKDYSNNWLAPRMLSCVNSVFDAKI